MKDYRPGQGDGILIIVSINVSSIRTSKSFISLVAYKTIIQFLKHNQNQLRHASGNLFIYLFIILLRTVSVPVYQTSRNSKAKKH